MATEPPVLTASPPLSVAPIECVALPRELDGTFGRNRAKTPHPQISAQNDVDAVKAWLARFADTPTTFNSYRKEAERLLLWSVVERGKSLSSLTHEDLLAIRHFSLTRGLLRAG